MTSESMEFIQTVFARSTVGAVALTALPVGQGSTLTCHIPHALPGLLTEALARLERINAAGTVSAFVGMATRRLGLTRYQRGGRADLLELPVLFADIDRPPTETYPFLSRFKPPPSLVVA